MQTLEKLLNEKGLILTPEMREKFLRFFDVVVDYNTRVNLTAITAREDFFDKHYYDSLCAVSEIPEGARVLDIGSGAGFPAIPLKLVRDDLSFVMLDSVQKKVAFLEYAVQELALTGMTARHDRVEDYAAGDGREAFDVCTARAVAPLATLLEYAIPALRVGGLFIAYKTDVAELATAMSALDKLHATLEKTEGYTLPNGDKRTLFLFRKTAPTDAKYPRGGNKPRQFPL